jgi:hypothetical protein
MNGSRPSEAGVMASSEVVSAVVVKYPLKWKWRISDRHTVLDSLAFYKRAA